MRVTRASLIRIAKETTKERAYNDPSLVAAYLTGSLLNEGDPMLGGTTDIDMVYVHNASPDAARQIVRLTPDFHLDIRHCKRDEFSSPRELRTDPYLGWELYDPMLLYQREKFFEFIQAGLRAGFEFNAPPLVLARCRTLYDSARATWFELSDLGGEKAGSADVLRYLTAVNEAANAVAELSGGPLAERRLLQEFPKRAQAVERPEFTGTLFKLMGAQSIDADVLESWLEPWRTEFLAGAERGRRDGRVHAARLNYYEKGMRALLAGETPLSALWPLINTWTMAANMLFEPFGGGWTTAFTQLGMLGTALDEKIIGLDKFLDEIEAVLDEVAAANGLETSASI